MKDSRSTSRNRLFVLKRSILKYTLLTVTGIFVLNMPAAYAANKKTHDPGKMQDLAASVNGVSIKNDDLTPQVNANLRKYKKYAIQKQDNELLKALKTQALEKLISVELIYQEARKINIKDLDKRVTDKLNELIENNGEQEDFDEKKLRSKLRKKIMIEHYLIKNKLKDSEPPESDVKAYYEKNKEAFTRNESVKTRHILVSLKEDATIEEKTISRNKIKEARKLILGGKPFAEIAKEYSDCNSASSGGELGNQERGYMPQAFDDVAFSLENGKLSDIIETEFGYHILEVLDHKTAGIQSYEEVKDFIGRYLKIQHTKKAMDTHLSMLRKKAKIDIYL